MAKIKGQNIKKDVRTVLECGVPIQKAVKHAAKKSMGRLTAYEADEETLEMVVSAVQYYAQEVHPEFLTNADLTDQICWELRRELEIK